MASGSRRRLLCLSLNFSLRMHSASTSAVRFFLSSALSPRMQTASRWTAVNAVSCKAFAITGKDTGSPFLRFLAEGRGGEDRATFEAAAASLGIDEEIDTDGFVDWYRQLNHGYPFLDYSKAETRAVDANLMSAYAAADHAPPIVTRRDALSRVLAPGKIDGD